MRKYLTLFLLLLSCSMAAQNLSFDNAKKRVVGLNMNTLLSVVIPGDNQSAFIGPYTAIFRTYKKENSCFNFALGLNVSDVDEENIHFNVALGVNKIKSFREQWKFFSGLEFFLSGGGFNTETSNDLDAFAFGLRIPLGIEFQVNDFLSLHTESAFLLGMLDGLPMLEFQAPLALYLNVHFWKEK